MNPFRYPDALHVRSQEPPPFSDYRRYRPYLRTEFSRQCVYCRMPDGFKGPDAFGVDHYKPVARFPGLRSEYSNLFYACNVCNRRKSDFWTDKRLEAGRQFIPNPCAHSMATHLQYQGAVILPKTPAGLLTEQLLMLNSAEDVQYREFVLRTIERCLLAAQELLVTLDRLDARLISSGKAKAEEILRERQALRLKLEDLGDDLERLTGTRLLEGLAARLPADAADSE